MATGNSPYDIDRDLGEKKRPPPTVYQVTNQIGMFNSDRPIRPGAIGTGESVGFHAFDEGLPFYKRLESLNELVFRAGGHPSCVDRLFAVLRPKETIVYLNDRFDYTVVFRAKRLVEAGQWMGCEDIVGFERVKFYGVDIPNDAGILVLLSHGWRKAFFFDFQPVLPPPFRQLIDYDVEIVAAQLLSHLFYTEYFLLSQEDWDKIIASGWFPFISLVGTLWDGLIDGIRHGEDLTYHEEQIHTAFAATLGERLQSWSKKSTLSDEAEILERAVDSYQRGDWISTISLLCPRIEGILNRSLGWPGGVRKLMAALTQHIEGSTHQRSLLFPVRLQRYLEDNFFQYVDFQHDSSTLNRHTVAHGVATPKTMTREKALKLLLLLDHLFYCIPG